MLNTRFNGTTNLPPNQKFLWKRESNDAARSAFHRGLSFGQAAVELMREFGGLLSRGSVAGKWNRMGLKRGRSNHHHNQEADTMPHEAKPKRVRKKANWSAKPRCDAFEVVDDTEILPLPAEPPPDADMAQHRKSLLDLGPRDCRWPHGDPRSPDFFFCGYEATFGSYCAHHARIAFQ